MKCYDFLAGEQSPRYLGGIEKDLVTLARIFADSGLSIAMLTFDQGQEAGESVHGVDVFPCYRPDAGLPVLRFAYPRAWRIIAEILKANAAITIVMGVGAPVAWAALAAKLRKRNRFVFLTASDSDCAASLPLVKTGHEKVLYRFGLARADVCFVQSGHQRDALRRNFGKDGELLRIPAYASSVSERQVPRSADGPDRGTGALKVTWIGRLSPEKRPERVLEIAEQCSDVQFSVAGGANTQSQFARELLERMKSAPNVIYHGKLPPADMQRIYDESDYVLNTSDTEGFPATFREAWHFGKPVISIVDPDSLIADHRAGFAASGMSEIVSFLESGAAKDSQAELSRNASEMYGHQFSERQCLDRILTASNSGITA